MKNLKTLQTLSKMGKILSRIGFVFAMIGACGCIIGLLSCSMVRSCQEKSRKWKRSKVLGYS